MNRNWKKAVASLVVLALVAVLSFGCAEKAEEEVVVITIGELTDLTGPASPAIRSLHYCLEDMVRYYNEEGLIPGTELRIVSWDTKYDPSRAIPGYDWVRGKGAKLIISVEPPTGVVLKPFVDKDQFPVVNLSTNMAMLEPPGWIFTMSSPHYYMMKALLKWIAEEHWDQDQGIAKVGIVGWEEVVIVDTSEGMEDYCQEHQDQFDYVGAFMTPFGTWTWTAEIEKLKDCDYICATGIMMADFINQFQGRGHSATFIDVGVASAYRGYFVEKSGWEALDGTLSANVSLYRDQSTTMVEQAKMILQRYHPGEVEDILDEGLSYTGGWHNLTAAFEILKQAVEEVGAENFDGQAFYDAAVEYRTTSPMWEGYPEGWGFTETKRYLVNDVTIYEFDADAEDMVRIIDDWLPLVE